MPLRPDEREQLQGGNVSVDEQYPTFENDEILMDFVISFGSKRLIRDNLTCRTDKNEKKLFLAKTYLSYEKFKKFGKSIFSGKAQFL